MRFYIAFSKKLFVVLLAVFFSATTMRAQLNQLNAEGHRQGAWIFDGDMIKDPAYSAYAKVEEGDYINGEKTGLWKRYWPDGHLRSEINFMKGQPEGPYKIYYTGGQLEEAGNWSGSKNTSQFQRYYANGRPKEKLIYDQEGTRQGVQKYYHDNGALALEVGMESGAEHGLQKRYDSSGQLLEERQFDHGKVKAGGVKSYITPAQTKSAQMADISPGTGHHTNGAQDFDANGFNVMYNINGQVSMVGDFINGKLYNGRLNHFDNNGLPAGTEIYIHGLSTGQVNSKQNSQ